jgi:hypothetical protein
MWRDIRMHASMSGRRVMPAMNPRDPLYSEYLSKRPLPWATLSVRPDPPTDQAAHGNRSAAALQMVEPLQRIAA